jgi:kojibiose phosphorylase
MDNLRNWVIIKTESDPESLAAHNAVFCVSNGYLSLRGNLLESRRDPYPGTFVAGVFDTADMMAFIRPTKEERRYLDSTYFDDAQPSPSVANLPDPLFVRVFSGGRELVFRGECASTFEQQYNLRAGTYSYMYTLEAASGQKTRIEMTRSCDMTHQHRALMRYRLTPVNYSGTIRLQSGIDGSVRSNLVGDRQFEIVEMRGRAECECEMGVQTLARSIGVDMAVANRVGGIDLGSPRAVVEAECVYNEWEFELGCGCTVTLDKFTVVSTTEDARHGFECDPQAELRASVDSGFDAALKEQESFWSRVWDRCDVGIEGHDTAQLYLRFCIMHLISSAPRHTDRLSVPCKLLTGEHYQGTTFYDSDLYIAPFYLFTYPELARTLLSYRWHGLEEGRRIAAEQGQRGAKFAWQAGPYGEECLGKWWRFVKTNVHINGDVAYALMLYHRATGDDRFMLEKGVDILVETARFYASRMEHDEARDEYGMSAVAGPDEGHCESRNNFYTNLMAKKNLRAASFVLRRIRDDLPSDYQRVEERLALGEVEIENWGQIEEKTTLLYDVKTKLFEQREGFFALPPVPADLLDGRKVWFVTVAPYQAMNQPDVVMALVLLRDEFDLETKRANWDYYRSKSMDFSSMSYAVNSMMAAELGEMGEAYRAFLVSAGMDLDPTLTGRRDTKEGLHGTAMGGAWMAAVLGFGGVRVTDEGLAVAPKLPPGWKSLSFKIIYHGEELSFSIDEGEIQVSMGRLTGSNVRLKVAGSDVTLKGGEARTFPR